LFSAVMTKAFETEIAGSATDLSSTPLCFIQHSCS
jgi:hypothetical protein